MRKGILKIVLLFAGLLALSVGQAKASGKKESSDKLSMVSVRQVVKSHLLEVQKCYTDLIIEGMAKKGKVVVTWDIDDKGAVQNLTVKENTSNDQAVAGCVTEKVPNWPFMAAESGKTFPAEYQFKFGE
jgi:hypothetical protein